MTKKEIIYVAEINLPSKSAYSIHVMKMCEAFSNLGYNLNLFVINGQNYYEIYNYYNIRYRFKFFSVFNKPLRLNFFLRIFFSLKIIFKIRNKNSIIISRSIIFSLFAALLEKNITLELHHEISGFSKIIFILLKNFGLIKNLKYIFIQKDLSKIYKTNKKKFLILDDAVNTDDFTYKKKLKFKNTCVYTGSFFEGKGVEQILRLAKKNKNINFHLYGEKKFLKVKIKEKNIKIFDFINYRKIPRILSKYEIALMPYQKKVKGRSSINLEKYMSPLKMFDYLAAKMIIIASDLKVYQHILKNNFNCKLLKVNDDKVWSETINLILKNRINKSFLKKNAYRTALKHTWKKRCIKIINKLFIK